MAGEYVTYMTRRALSCTTAGPGRPPQCAPRRAWIDPLTFVERAGAGLGLPGAGGVAADGEVLLAVAARVGRTRLIDNALIDLG